MAKFIKKYEKHAEQYILHFKHASSRLLSTTQDYLFISPFLVHRKNSSWTPPKILLRNDTN